jgi:hypothetical protein
MIGRPAAAAIGVACGCLAGCLYLAVALGTPGALILVYMSQLPLFVAGLWLGSVTAAIAGLTGFVVLLAASDLLGAAVFVALNAAPVVLLVRQALLARRNGDGTLAWYPPGKLAAWLAALALCGIAAMLLLLGGPEGLQLALRDIVGEALDRVARQPLPNRDAIVRAVATVIPGVVAASWMITSVGNGALAQGLLARFGASWRPSPDLAALSLPMWLPAALGLAAAATLIGGAPRYIGINALIALSVPFCLAGLAVLHMAVRRLSNPAMALMLFYTTAALFGWPFLAIAILGLLESWLGLRRRLAPHGANSDG